MFYKIGWKNCLPSNHRPGATPYYTKKISYGKINWFVYDKIKWINGWTGAPGALNALFQFFPVPG